MQKTHCRSRTSCRKIGDLITADHKVLSEGCESRNNHRYAVVVQDLATLGSSHIREKTKTSQETQRSLQKFLEPDRNPKVIYTDNPWEFGKACEDLFWNHRTSTPHRPETNGIAERVVCRIKEETSAVLLQSGLDGKWWADSTECYCYLRNVQDPPVRWENTSRKAIWKTIQRSTDSVRFLDMHYVDVKAVTVARMTVTGQSLNKAHSVSHQNQKKKLRRQKLQGLRGKQTRVHEKNQHEDTMCEKTSAGTTNARQVPRTHKTNTTSGCTVVDSFRKLLFGFEVHWHGGRLHTTSSWDTSSIWVEHPSASNDQFWLSTHHSLRHRVNMSLGRTAS